MKQSNTILGAVAGAVMALSCLSLSNIAIAQEQTTPVVSASQGKTDGVQDVPAPPRPVKAKGKRNRKGALPQKTVQEPTRYRGPYSPAPQNSFYSDDWGTQWYFGYPYFP